jgi:hypothetical protein
MADRLEPFHSNLQQEESGRQQALEGTLDSL